MYVGEKPRKGLSKFVAVLTALVIASASLLAVPAYAAESGAENHNPVEEFIGNVVETLGLAPEANEETDGNIQLYAAGDKGIKKSDPSTIDAWNNILQEEGQASTQNIGRIWTDKSVFTENAQFTQGPLAGQPIDVDGDHDFLVGLSALSSTSNLSSTTHTSQPLDIVLVLDDSGSMAYDIDSDVPEQTVYTPLSADEVVESHGELRWTSESGWFWETEGNRAYQLSEPEDTYYVSIDGRWVEVTEETSRVYGDGDYSYTSYREHVRWMAGNQEVDPETTTFYTRTVYDMSERRGALQYAVSNFIDQAAAMNAQITDENAKIRLSIVVFASNSSIENHLTVCEGANVDALKGTLNDLSANGATNAGAGMTSANNELRQNSNRDNTKQIVIFFTDGVPTTSDSFASGVANTAVDQAGAIKGRGGSVYSIGIFDGANPNETEVRYEGSGWNQYPVESSQANVFMNAVSSNYPNSTAWNNLGQRATGNPDFYKSADNAGSLNEVFQDIFDESTEGSTSGSPIEGTDVEGVQDAVPGTLTFTDTLGDYMEVTGNNMTLVYGGKQYSAAKGEDGVYRFPEQTVDGNDIYRSAKLSDITISIQKGEGSAGDTVTVSMPASFIPLRNYTVTTVDGKTEMSVTDAYPIRLFYGVSVKQDVLDNLGDPSNTTLQDYINKNKTGGGSVNFYANKWSGEQFGDTTATFTPNEGNKFYYYTDNTELYIDENCNTRANRWNISDADTLYYKDTYWVQNGTSGSEETEVLSISVSGQDAQGLEYDRNNNAYIEAGTRRYDRPAGLASDKDENTTSTATDVLNPTWSNGTTVSQRLGNNGVIPVELPAQLSVTKEVKFGGEYGTVGFDETKYTNRSYEMTIHVDGASGTYKAQVTNAQGDVVSTPAEGYFDITFNDDGNATQSLKDGETLTIYGLDALVDFKVTEEALGNGFTADYFQQTGQLKADGTSNVVVTNTYTLSSTTGNGSELFKGTKVLDGRDWANGDTFTFQITGQDGAPTPTPNTVTVSSATTQVDGHDAATFNFGDVTYDTPGVYKYTIVETKPATAHPGMSYSSATYEVEVTVADKGDGTMTVTPKMSQTQADNVGDDAAGELGDVNAVFTNHFSETDTTAVLGAYKNYSNNSGNADMDLADDMFTIELRPTGDNADEAPMPANVQNDENGRFAITTNADNNFDFDRITYDNMMGGKTFTYQIREVRGTVTNMNYDGATYTVQVTVNVNEQNRVSVDTAYFDADGDPLGAGEDGQAIEPTFVNKYDPTDATLTDDNAIHGDKTLTGRDMQQGETFGFTLTPRSQEAIAGVRNDTITIEGNDWTSSVSEGKNGVAKGFSFGNMTFTRAGEYIFTVTETSHNDEALPASDNVAGMTYDRDACTVTVTVTDENGALTSSVSYNNGADQPTDRAVFENAYASSVEFGTAEGGINVTKKLTGRNMTADEFAFSVKAVEADGSVDATTADAKLAEADRSFTNPTGAMSGIASQAWKQLASMTFNQDDAGKTFVYEVRETTTGTDVLAVDTAVYTVSLTPHDNADGSMYVTGTVTKGDAEYASIDTSAEDYTAPTLAFENVYTPKPISTSDGDETTLQVTKQVTGAPSFEAFDFELTLDTASSDNGADGVFSNEEATQAFVSAKKSTSANIAADATETVKFDQLTFTKAGTYTFKVKETTTSDLDYWTYDNTERTITVEVSDNNGKLEILYAQGNNRTVENKYSADPVIVGGDGAQQQITVQKSVTGADSTADFKFKIEPVIDDDHTKQWWQDRVKATEGFSPELTISGVKQAQPVTNSFAGIEFNAVGEYKFNVTEVGAADFNAGTDRKGWTYDEHTATVTVTVTDEGNDGQLDAVVVYDNDNATTEADKTAQAAAFTNKYVPAEVTTGDDVKTGIQVTKKVTGHDAIEAFEFSLSLKEGQNGDAVFEGTGENKTKFDGMTLTTSDGIKAGATETKTFDDITFTAAGDYIFVIDETTEKTDSGWTYSTNTAEVTVHVKDDGNGALYIESIDGNAPEFENIYKLTPGKFRAAYFKLQGNKVLDGRNWKAGDEFTFTLTAGEGENVDGSKMAEGDVTATMPAKTTDTIKPFEDDSKVSDNTAQFTFTSDRIPGGSTVAEDTFTYTKPGTYRYLIRETNPNVATAGSGILGVSYDQTVYRLTVVVTDKGDGTLDAKGTYTKQEANGEWTELGGSDQITFTNTYSSDKVNITFNAFKVLKNRETPMKDNEFMFHMEFAGWKANDDQSDNWSMDGEVAEKAPDPAADKGNIIRGDVTFAGMDFTADQVGYTYRYAITEVNGGQTINGVTLDDSTHYVTAKVTSVQQANEDGTFTEHVRVETSGEAEYDEQNQTAPTTGAVFTNVYDPGETTVDTGNADFDLTKILKGKDWNGDKFTFTISAVSAMNGDQEIIAADSPDFPMPAETTLTVDAATDEDEDGNDLAVFSFGNIKYDREGVYTYQVAEKTPVEGEEGYNAGITYSENTATVVVTVTDNNEGGYTTAVNITNNEFVNEYHAKAEYNASGVGGLDITKQVTNHAMANGQFSFTITAGDGASAKKLGITDGLTTTVESAEAAAGVVESVKSNPFETVTFNETDDGVTYKYTISENGKTGEGDYKNYVLDTNTYTVEITPTDNGDGTMTVKTVVNGTETTDQRTTVAFVNSYQADPTTVGAQGDAKIEGTKTLKNDDLADGQFTFQVMSGNVVVAEGTNDASGNITFSDIEYTTDNLAAAASAQGSPEVGKITGSPDVTDAGTVYTFDYTVSEVTPDQNTGVTANTGAQYITVTVTDDGNGTLTPVVSYDNGTSLAFENTYGGNSDFALKITGKKEIVGGQTNPTNIPTLKGGEYEFTITGAPAKDGTPAPMPRVTTAKNGAAGGVTFEDIHYTMENTFGNKPATTNTDVEAMADEATTDEVTTDEGIETYTAGRTQVFTYTISESGSVAGVTNEQGTKTVEVTVKDLGGGKLEAKVTSEKVNGADFKFTNVYDVTETTSSLTGDGGFTITKDFSSTNTDRALAEGDFEFQLKGGDTVITATNAADGTVSFGGITFTKPGTYNYVLSEVDGGKPGVDYDTTGYNVTAKAEDQGNGTLKVTWEMPQAVNDGVTFTNTYTAANTGITFEAAKVLDGRELTDGEFTFELRENGKVIDTATNDADGTVAFEKVEYTEPGAHDYEIAEVEGDDSTITYDDTVFTVHVNVIDNTQTGSLDASDWSYGENGAPVFHNTYTEPAEPPAPKPEEPKPEVIPATGDAAAAAVMATAGIGAALAAAGYVTSKKRGE